MSIGKLAFVALIAGFIAACDSEPTTVSSPTAIEVTDEATGHYCGMLLVDHEGPKGQIHLAGREEPVWFSSVRDTIAFTRLAEEPRGISAIYVNDMARAQNWSRPEPGTWIDAREAWFVVESDRRGGMGAPEAVPFSEQEAAEAFRSARGGRLVRLDDVPDDYVLGPVELDPAPEASDHGATAGHASH